MQCIVLHCITLHCRFLVTVKGLKLLRWHIRGLKFVLFCPDDGVPSLIVSFRITQFCVTVPRLLPNVGFVSRSGPRGSKYLLTLMQFHMPRQHLCCVVSTEDGVFLPQQNQGE